MDIRQFTVNEMEHFKRMMPKDNGFRIIFTHNFSQKFKDNKFNLILDFLKNTDYNLTKNKVHLIKNNGFFGQCGQDITKNSLVLEFDNIDDSSKAIFYALYLAETYRERFVVYLYKEKIAYHVRYSELDYYQPEFEEIMRDVKTIILKKTLLEIDKLLYNDFIILGNNEDGYTHKITDEISYGISGIGYYITILPKIDTLEYLKSRNKKTEHAYLWYKVNYILIKENNSLYKYDMRFDYIKTYKVNNITNFIKRAFYKNIIKIEKCECVGISYRFAPHNIYKTTTLYQKVTHTSISSI